MQREYELPEQQQEQQHRQQPEQQYGQQHGQQQQQRHRPHLARAGGCDVDLAAGDALGDGQVPVGGVCDPCNYHR